MPFNGYDIAYRTGLALAWPLWGTRAKSRAKVQDALATRRGAAKPRHGTAPAVLIHAVSVGELNAAKGLIDAVQTARPGVHVIVTTTTTAGHELATKLYAARDDMTVARFPLDLSDSIDRLLNAVRPTAVVLMELEVWPNFLRACHKRQIPVMVANGRVTEPSFNKYRLLGPLGRMMFRRLRWCAVQDEVYAARFQQLGVPADRVAIAGTMKFDTATVGDRVPGDESLARELGLPMPTDEHRPRVWVAGSTGPGEEEIVLDVFKRLQSKLPTLRLVIAPRKPERFDEVADLIRSRGFQCLRRSAPSEIGNRKAEMRAVILGDTMGELRKFYALADVVFCGRSLVDLGPKQHGSDMIEPCALAKPTAVGPFTGNFLEPMNAFRAADGIAEVADAQRLYETINAWLNDPAAAAAVGQRAQHVVVAGKGALERHLLLLMPLLG